jgi:predicted acyl esterase
MTAVAAGPPFSRTTSSFHATGLGPDASHVCDIAYDLYVPTSATATSPAPAILTTNGFGGSKDDQKDNAQLWASNGYVVLSYSGLGFGGSSCQIGLDSPEWDGRAASELVSFLASRPEVLKDSLYDPRIGTAGGSYGGGFQFALASVDHRVDAMVPDITWNDLSYSFAPNNYSASLVYDGYDNPGVYKEQWTSLFFALGNAEPVLHQGRSGWTDNRDGRPSTGTFNPACPGFHPEDCAAFTNSATWGFPKHSTIDTLHAVSAQYTYFDSCKAGHYPPTLLTQGETDTLFLVNEAVANYNATKACGGDAKLVLRFGGHSGLDAAGEYSSNPHKGYLTRLELNWFDHYLKGTAVATGPEVEYFKDWVIYDHTGSAQPAYGTAPAWPVGGTQAFYLSSGGLGSTAGKLVSSPGQVVKGKVEFASIPGGQAGYSEVANYNDSVTFVEPTDPEGTFGSFTSAPLAANLDSAGIPTVDFSITDANAAANLTPEAALVLFGKLYDVAPNGSRTLVRGLVAPIRVMDTTKPVHLNLPGMVHRYADGHRLQLVLATSDASYIGSRASHALTIKLDPTQPMALTLPVGA